MLRKKTTLSLVLPAQVVNTRANLGKLPASGARVDTFQWQIAPIVSLAPQDIYKKAVPASHVPVEPTRTFPAAHRRVSSAAAILFSVARVLDTHVPEALEVNVLIALLANTVLA